MCLYIEANYINSSFPEGVHSIAENWGDIENHKIDELHEFSNYYSSRD